jgi:competence protein CoiA
MKYALVEGERREAQPGLSGKCCAYGHPMIAKCGQQRDWHWAHLGTYACDRWWEPETPWHRAWKNHFPKECQEFIHQAANGEKHIADVKTKSGVVLEFQHSFLRREEREAREMFYHKMVWVVDGRKRRRDKAQFFTALDAAVVFNREPLVVSIRSDEGALLRDWGASSVPVYFDFGDSEPGDKLHFDAPILWRLNLCTPNGMAYLSPLPKTLFLRVHLEGLDEMDYSAAVKHALAVRAALVRQQAPRPLIGFERYMAKQRARRRRF